MKEIRRLRDKILIGCILCLFSFIPKGTANNYIMNPYTHQEISADSIIERVMTFAPLYETIVSDYRANLYIKGKMDICLLYTSPSPRDVEESRMPSSA